MSSELREPDVREFLERMAQEMPTPLEVHPHAIRRAHRKLVRTVIAGSLAAGLAVVGALSGTRALLRSEPQPADSRDWEPVTAIPIDHVAAHIAVGEGGVWVAGSDYGSAGVTRVDPATGEVVARLPGRSAYGCALAVGEGAAWVVGPGLIRIDPDSNEVSTVQGGSGRNGCIFAGSLFIGGGYVWIADYGAISRIDPSTYEVTKHVGGVGVGPPLACLDGVCWVRSTEDFPRLSSDLVGLVPDTGEVVARIPGRFGGRLVTGFGSLWVTTRNDLVRIDPSTGTVLATWDLVAPDVRIAIGEGALWIAFSEGVNIHVLKIDPSTNKAVGDLAILRPPEPRQTADIAAGSGAVWLTDGVGTLFRIDPEAVAGTTAWIAGTFYRSDTDAVSGTT